jgi:hypothetical protein
MADMGGLKAHDIRLSTPRSLHSSRARAPLPVMTRANRTPSSCALRRKRSSMACASSCVRPWRSMRASIGSLPRASRCLSRRSSGSSRGAGFGGGALTRDGGFGWSEGAGFVLPGGDGTGVAAAGTGWRRSGATERVIRLQSVCSSAVSLRRRSLTSSAVMTATALDRGQPAGALSASGCHPRPCPPPVWRGPALS